MQIKIFYSNATKECWKDSGKKGTCKITILKQDETVWPHRDEKQISKSKGKVPGWERQ